MTIPERLHLQPALLCGPGPTNIDESVQQALQTPLRGYLDPAFLDVLGEVVTMLTDAWNVSAGLALPLSSTGTAAMETGIQTLLAPGDTLVVGVAGYFGRRIVEIASRHGVQVVEVPAAAGKSIPIQQLLETVADHPQTRAVAVVHAETSTGVQQPLADLGAALAVTETLLIVDCVTSLGGSPLEPEAWGLDYCYSCSQKCLGAPPGLAPIWLSERARDRARTRRSPLFTFDVEALARYWSDRPATYHHTPPAIHIYAMHEALRALLEEGLERRWQRHRDAGGALRDALRQRSIELLADDETALPQLTALRVPNGIDGSAARRALLDQHSLEIGGSLDPSLPLWRIGLMGPNANLNVVARVLEALDAVLQPA